MVANCHGPHVARCRTIRDALHAALGAHLQQQEEEDMVLDEGQLADVGEFLEGVMPV